MGRKPRMKCFVAAPLSIEIDDFVAVLREMEIETWNAFDFPTRPGASITEELKKKLSLSDFLLAVLSEPSEYILYEIGVAQGLGKPVFLVILSDVVLPKALEDVMHVRIVARDLEPFSDQLDLFLESLRRKDRKWRRLAKFDLVQLKHEVESEDDIDQIRTLVDKIASRSKETAWELLNTLNLENLAEKLDDENDVQRIGEFIGIMVRLDSSLASEILALLPPTKLKALIEDPNASVRAITVEALGRTDSSEGMSLVRGLLEDDDSEVRTSATRALLNFPSRNDFSGIRRLLKDKSSNVRSAAVEVLGRIATDDDVSLIEGMLGDQDYQVRRAAVQAFRGVKPNTIQDFLDKIESLREHGDERQMHRLVTRILETDAITVITPRPRMDVMPDMSLWVDALESVWGNPTIVELKYGTLSERRILEAQRQLLSYLTKTNAKAGIVIYLDKAGRRFEVEEFLSPNILCFELFDLVSDLEEFTFEEIVTRRRNVLVHGKGA